MQNPKLIQPSLHIQTPQTRQTRQLSQSPQSPPSTQTQEAMQQYNHRHILPNFKYRDRVINGFGKVLHSYNLTVCKRDDIYRDKLDTILYTEGCAICMQTSLKSPYNDNYNDNYNDTKKANVSPKNNNLHKDNLKLKKLDEEFEDLSLSANNADDRYSFMIAQCPSLKMSAYLT